MKPETARSSIGALIGDHRDGHALEGGFYTRQDVFEKDMRLLLDRWVCAGHVSDVPQAGDWLTTELGRESAIVVRGDDGVLRALANVCRHRGSRICDARRGAASILTCPYHAWTYHLDGTLRRAREMPTDFDPSDHGLQRLALAEIGGLMFVSFGPDPPGLGEAGEALGAMTRHFGWESARVAERRQYDVAANWKLVMENYHECYHCAPAHPEFSVLHTLARPGARRLASKPDSLTGISDHEAWDPAPGGREVGRVMHSPLASGCLSGSRDGGPVAPLMGGAPRSSGTSVFSELGFLAAFLAYPDYGVIYRFMPCETFLTRMELIWLVRADAVEGRDYVLEDLCWLWEITSLADKAIIERNQQGVRSRFYRPGPFSLMEPGAAAYVARYLRELALVAGDC